MHKKRCQIVSSLYEKIEMLCKEHKESITTMCKVSGASIGKDITMKTITFFGYADFSA